MATDSKKTTPIANDTPMPLDLNGSEQHHDLKNQPGEKGDPEHTKPNGGDKGKADGAIKDTLEQSNEKTTMSAELKDAAK